MPCRQAKVQAVGEYDLLAPACNAVVRFDIIGFHDLFIPVRPPIAIKRFDGSSAADL
jgi:hypothetical protein